MHDVSSSHEDPILNGSPATGQGLQIGTRWPDEAVAKMTLGRRLKMMSQAAQRPSVVL